ncbi:3-methyladenine DNA glycosylase [Arthrobacter sulfonylureivorans]|uniref:3-methyladenine DNA glycosylase n=1 Tax=Arthrobacter sulfonylureivorans TaxID=2486855 RepID=A0ABY3W977_9MICC|nr:3-methyladenine DNA glycosylase [Arthrobacter sulfonylureivorans]UNK45770.1 3-methyladenine DNA glycosylase [Arthrobacter sulfonylureivorans]
MAQQVLLDRPQVLGPELWLPRARAHAERAGRFTEPYLQRRSAGLKHPVEDFLFTYYSLKPGQLLRWHPGAGVVLAGTEAGKRRGWKFYRELTAAEGRSAGLEHDGGAVTVDAEAFLAARGTAVAFSREILAGAAARPARFGCFGLHEWAMAYKSRLNGVRHDYLALRLGAEGTDQVVEGSRINCSHFDAFRFYTPQAVPLNTLRPTRENQRQLEQPGCLHANMDLYKWAYKLSPALPSELVMDCFELSWRIRELDMKASPYDLSGWGYEPVRIETTEGRAQYVAAQRAFAAEAQVLRRRLLEALDLLVGGADVGVGHHLDVADVSFEKHLDGAGCTRNIRAED